MDINEFLGIAIVGALLSVVIEIVTANVTDPRKTKLITILLALVVAGSYVWLRSTPFFQTALTVLGTASIVYGFFFNRKTE